MTTRDIVPRNPSVGSCAIIITALSPTRVAVSLGIRDPSLARSRVPSQRLRVAPSPGPARAPVRRHAHEAPIRAAVDDFEGAVGVHGQGSVYLADSRVRHDQPGLVAAPDHNGVVAREGYVRIRGGAAQRYGVEVHRRPPQRGAALVVSLGQQVSTGLPHRKPKTCKEISCAVLPSSQGFGTHMHAHDGGPLSYSHPPPGALPALSSVARCSPRPGCPRRSCPWTATAGQSPASGSQRW